MRQLSITGLLFWAVSVACLGTVPQSRPLNYARNFEIAEHPGYTLLSVHNLLQASSRSYRYALVPRGAPLPDLPEDAQVIRTPVRRVVVMETVYIGYMDALEQLSTIVGAATVDFISQPDVYEATQDGTIQSIQVGQSLDIESLLLLQPDLILTSISGDPSFDVPPKLLRSGLPVVITAGYMEDHPLARSEWIKFVAAFFEASDQAETIFAQTARRYETLTALTATVETRPTVFTGAPYSGAWYVAGGDSYAARAIEDAGGDYLWSGNSSRGGIPLDTERVFLKAAEADVWIDPSHYETLDALLAGDERFGQFRAAQTGQVYNKTRQVGANGGNNIWERGIVRPDEVLGDLIQIFHPEILPGRRLIYYEKLQRKQP